MVGCQRGNIEDKKRARQEIEYAGIRYKYNITPTDIDGFIEINDKVYIFIELKYNGATLKDGQFKALFRLVDVINKPSILIIADHYIHDVDKPIPAHECIVREYKLNGGIMHKPKKEYTLKKLIDEFLVLNGLDNYLINNDLEKRQDND